MFHALIHTPYADGHGNHCLASNFETTSLFVILVVMFRRVILVVILGDIKRNVKNASFESGDLSETIGQLHVVIVCADVYG